MSEELMQVNGASVDTRTALQWQLLGGDTAFLQATVSNASVVQYAKENNIQATPDDIQSFLNEFRYALELEKAEDFNVWLKGNGLDMGVVAQYCEIGALRNLLRQSITDEDCNQFFNENPTLFEVADLYSMTVESKDLADELRAQIEDEEATFQSLALEHSVDGDTFRQGGFVGEVTRETVRGEVEAEVFSAELSSIIGPIKDDDGYSLYMVSQRRTPQFDDIKKMIGDELFKDLLDEIQATSKVAYSLLGFEEEEELEDEDED